MGKDESVAYCLAMPERPPTPEHDARYRTVKVPGRRVQHFGYRADAVDEEAVYGSVDRRERISAHHVLDTRKPPMTAYTEQRAEDLHYRRCDCM